MSFAYALPWAVYGKLRSKAGKLLATTDLTNASENSYFSRNLRPFLGTVLKNLKHTKCILKYGLILFSISVHHNTKILLLRISLQRL